MTLTESRLPRRLLNFVVFVEQEIEECVSLLEKESVALSPQLGPLRILPLHSGLGGLIQRVYEPDPDASAPKASDGSVGEEAGHPGIRRRVILTDTLAEASFSLQDIRYVVDTGLQLKTVSVHEEPRRLVFLEKLQRLH